MIHFVRPVQLTLRSKTLERHLQCMVSLKNKSNVKGPFPISHYQLLMGIRCGLSALVGYRFKSALRSY